ncbi:PAS domain S-box protein [Hymenobacter properus]|uniref:histidine kinase n=1 Tax=Hymenobacter properus TaxID=2791026 RepID=A0A931FH80_9BACT|nr:PAS domain S-box protein [Hymenobacter properus]MBF9140772.1 PAS domain S-box protein [Hymenobacter properus]MBR7719581.1 PAS domain S-box protein [Microvirga sp. SRT04]
MNPVSTFSDAEWAAQLRAEQDRRAQAEAALAEAQARLTALENQLAHTASSAQHQHTQLTALVQNLQAGLVLVDQAGQIQFVNQHFWELFGLPPVAGPAEGGPPIPYAAVHIDEAFADPAAFMARARALHAAGQTVLQEEFTLADGRVVELDYLVLDTVGAGRLICYRDVTERHRRDEELRTLSYIPAQSPNAILRLTAAGEVDYANPAARLLLDALAAEAPGTVPQRLQALAEEALHAPLASRRTLDVAGQHYQFSAVAVPEQPFVSLYLTNVTERHLAEQRLAEQRAFYEGVLEQVPSAVAVFDAEHRYLFVNPAVEPDPAVRAWMLGKTSSETGPPRQRPEAIMQARQAAFAEAVKTEGEVVWEEMRPGPDGPVHFLLRYRSARDADGALRVISSGFEITARKQAEEKLARQREFYESILNLLPVDVAVFDAKHRFLFVNPSSISDPQIRQQAIGLTNAEYFALRGDRQPAGIAEQREQYFDLAVRTRTDVTWEEMRTDRKQRPQLIVRHLRPVFDADGQLRMVVGAGIDITARYTAEKLQHEVQQMLQVQQNFVRQILDALPNVLYLVDPSGAVSFANPAYETMIGHGSHWQPEGASEPVREEMRQMQALNQLVRTTQQPQVKEMPFTLKTGETRYFNVHKRPLRRLDGQFDILTISTDVTAVKQARQALERREKQYHDLVYYSQALICTHDLAGVVLSVNPAIERLMGLPAAQLVGRSLQQAIPAEHHAAVQAYLGDTQQVQSGVVQVLAGGGERRYLQYYTYEVREEGYPTYVVASGYDVTEGILAQKALQQAKWEAEENAQAKEDFLARMSHEIRTPLNGVLGMASLLQKTELTPAQRDYLATMQHAGQHLLALLNDVLDMAKITTQHAPLNRAPFDLRMALQGAGQTVAALAAAKGLALVVEPLAAAVPRVVGDAYRLHQVLLNLLSNAIKFTEKGQVRLGADVIEENAEALTVHFRVEDTGIGISVKEQIHIFDAFAQASADTSRRYGGTGLGLAISQQLVAQMGGALRLSSRPGQGTVFMFLLTLPRAQEAAEAPAPAPARLACENLRGLRVLLAEDNVVNQRIAMAVLEHWGVQVTPVSNGRDALAELLKQPFDAALLDIRMPGLTGVQVTEAIRRHPEMARARVPIIALTANAFEADRAAYLAAGMNACLTKPYEEADLCQLLLELTEQN